MKESTAASKQLPLYDAEADIACTLNQSDMPSRRNLISQMRDAAAGLERTENGIVLTYPVGAKELFASFAIAEKECCAFFGFDVTDTQMRWEASPDASALVDKLYEFFSNRSIDVSSLGL